MSVTRYQIIKQDVVAKIESGQWKSGFQIPSENQLAADYGVSRMTARRAITELTDAGVLSRSQGARTIVAQQLPTGSLLNIRSIKEEIEERGHSHHAEVLSLETRKTDEALATWFEKSVDVPLHFSRVLHFETDTLGNTRPIQLEERWVNPSVIPKYLEQDFTRITPSAYLSEISPLGEADHWVEATQASDEVKNLLDMATSEPCLKLIRRTYSTNTLTTPASQTIVSLAHLHHPGDRYRLGGHLVTGDKP